MDWGAYAIKVNGPELMSILEECYGDPRTCDPKGVIAQHASYASALGADKYVAFVAVEL